MLMNPRILMTALLVAITAFAGCLESEPTPPQYIPEDGDYNPFDNEAAPADSASTEGEEEAAADEEADAEPASDGNETTEGASEEEPAEEGPAEESAEEQPAAEEPAPAGNPNEGLPEPIVWSDIGLYFGVGCRGTSTSYFEFDVSLSGHWLFKIEGDSPLGYQAGWWAGDDLVEQTEDAGVIPLGSDNVGACAVEPSQFEMTFYHPNWVFDA